MQNSMEWDEDFWVDTSSVGGGDRSQDEREKVCGRTRTWGGMMMRSTEKRFRVSTFSSCFSWATTSPSFVCGSIPPWGMGRLGLPAFGWNKNFEGFSKISFLLFINFSDPPSFSMFVIYFCQEEKVGFGIVVKTLKNVGEVFRLVVGDDDASTLKKRPTSELERAKW